MQIEYVKLRSGDELIGGIQEDSPNALSNPWRMLLTPNGYVPCPIPVKEITLDGSEIVWRGEVDADLADVYRTKNGLLSVQTPRLSIPRPC
jgi:hypothetical protein